MARAAGHFLALGETLIDFIVADGADDLESAVAFTARPGGAPANVAVALARLGLPSAFAGVIGDDPFGRRLRDSLAREGVDVSRVEARPAVTTLAFAWKTAAGDGRFWILRNADLLLDPPLVERAGIIDLAAVIVGSVALAGEPSRTAVLSAVDAAAAAGVPVCFDVNLRPTLWNEPADAGEPCRRVMERATLVKLSVDDAAGLFGQELPVTGVFARCSTIAPQASVVLTGGSRGAWFFDGAAVHHLPAWAVAAVEPTGAGDAFMAALIKRLADHGWRQPTGEDVAFAGAAGALATTRPGAWDGLPTLAELHSFLEDRRDLKGQAGTLPTGFAGVHP